MATRVKFTGFVLLLLVVFTTLSGGIGAASAIHASATAERQALVQGGIVPMPELAQRYPSAQPEMSSTLPMQATGSIAYSGNHNGTDYDLFIQNVDDSIPLWLMQQGNDVTPRWSPDGQQLAFASDRNGDYDIYIRAADGTVRQLTSSSAADIHPSWSPDAQHILFASDRSGSYFQIYAVDVDGSNLRQITNISGNNAVAPAYAPNGSQIAFMRSSVLTVSCGWNWDIWKMDANGANQQRVTTQLGADVYPSWSPDGQYILYAECGLFDLDFDLHRAHAATGQTQYVMGDFWTNEWGGVYAPDGQYIAYSQSVSGAADVFVYSVVGGERSNLSSNPADDLAPHWRSEGVTDVCGAADLSRQPVMLVTGWSGSAEEGNDELHENKQLVYFRNWLGSYGYIEGCNLFYATGTSPYEYLAENGEIVRQELCRAADMVAQYDGGWNGRFDIIAHSYGGLRSRAFIEGDNYGAPCQAEHWNGRVYVDHLYTMGTPHGGEWPTLPFSVFIFIGAVTGDDGIEWPALIEMLPPVRTWQNLTQSQPDAVACYHLLGGDARPQVVYLPSLLFLMQIWPGILDSPNDLAVHQVSAHDLLFYASNYSRVHYVQTPDLHGQVPTWMDPLGILRSFVNPVNTFAEEIRPFLLRDQTGCPLVTQKNTVRPTATAVMDVVAQQQQPQPLPAVAMTTLATDEIGSNQTVNGQFNVATAEKSQITLYWSLGDLTLTLTNPQGQPINPDNVDEDENVDYLALDTGFGLMAAYQITNTVAGTWSYQVESGASARPVAYQLVQLPETQVAVTSVLPEWQAYNTPVVIAAQVVADGDTPVIGGTVTAEVQRPDGQLATLTLYDDGAHQDGAANDGTFANSYTDTDSGGFYRVSYFATGTYNGQPYVRDFTTAFAIAAATAALNGNYSDVPVDGNGDGLYEALQVQVGVQVNSNGRYTLSGDLYHGDSFVAHALLPDVALTTGSRAMALLFDGRDIRQSGLDGPYTLRNVLLLDETETSLLLQADDDVYTTAAYRADQFGIPIIYLPFVSKP